MSGNGCHAVGVMSCNRSGDIRPEEATEVRSFVRGLDESVQFWTDYLKEHLHPQSVLKPEHSSMISALSLGSQVNLLMFQLMFQGS